MYWTNLGPRELIRVDLYLEFRAGLRTVLTAGDIGALRAYLLESGRLLSDVHLVMIAGWPDRRLLPRRHQLILADPMLSTWHAASRLWLRRQGYQVPVTCTGYG